MNHPMMKIDLHTHKHTHTHTQSKTYNCKSYELLLAKDAFNMDLAWSCRAMRLVSYGKDELV